MWHVFKLNKILIIICNNGCYFNEIETQLSSHKLVYKLTILYIRNRP